MSSNNPQQYSHALSTPSKPNGKRPLPRLKPYVGPAKARTQDAKDLARMGTSFKGETCGYCGVDAYLTENTLLRWLQKGLESQNLQVVAIPGKSEGTSYGLVAPLIAGLRRKGIVVR